VRRRHAVRVALLAALVSSVATPLFAQWKGEGPVTLFLHYACKPEKRAAFRAHMAGPGVAQFEKWKKEQVFKDYLILFSSYVNPTWDMLVRLDFERYADTEKWKTVEQTTPGGLSPEGLALCSPTNAHLADLLFEKARPARDLTKARFAVFPFEYTKTLAAYKSYFMARPKFDLDGWVDGGAMAWYGVYANQYHQGPAWDILWVLEYKDTAGLAGRETVRQAMRKRYAESEVPGWRYARDTPPGEESRAPQQPTLADPILPR
jgi:hypothetical protein